MKKCTFAEYRNWVIINLLLNNGCSTATIRNIQIKDVDIENKVIYLRHTKNKRAQVIHLCEALCGVLREYMRVRGGDGDDYLFPNENGSQLTENGLRCTIFKIQQTAWSGKDQYSPVPSQITSLPHQKIMENICLNFLLKALDLSKNEQHQ